MDVYCVDSPYQKGWNVLRILEPRQPAGGRPRFQVWVLPVNPGLAEPWGDGLETLRQLREHGMTAKVMVHTTQGTPQHAREAWALGAREFLGKPFDAHRLLRIVKEEIGEVVMR